jgi:hemerythrin superfamily protein
MAPGEAALARSFAAQHAGTGRVVEGLRTVADGLDASRFDLAPVQAMLAALDEVLVPHEHAEEAELYPRMERHMGGPGSVAALSRTHAEIDRQLTMLRRLVGELAAGEVSPEDVVELRRLMYGLYAVLRLHDAQEEESLYSLVGDGPAEE